MKTLQRYLVNHEINTFLNVKFLTTVFFSGILVWTILSQSCKKSWKVIESKLSYFDLTHTIYSNRLFCSFAMYAKCYLHDRVKMTMIRYILWFKCYVMQNIIYHKSMFESYNDTLLPETATVIRMACTYRSVISKSK